MNVDDAHRLALPLLAMSLLVGPLASPVHADSASNYSIPLNGIFWSEVDIPVYIPYAIDSSEHKAVVRAIEVWNRALLWFAETYYASKPVPYRLVETPFAGTAHITVKFDDYLEEIASGNANYESFMPRHPIGLGHVSVTIRPEGFLGMHQNIEEQWVAIATHELGHALGLSHSSDPEDLMFTTPSRDWLPLPSTMDLYVLYELSERGPALVTTSYLPQEIPYSVPPAGIVPMSAKLQLRAFSPQITIETFSDGLEGQSFRGRPSIAIP